jgi:hypothetical protein
MVNAAARDELEDRVMDNDSSSGRGVGQWWLMTTTITTAAGVDEGN